MKLPENAPVKHIQSITINASIDRVWELVSDIENWPSWNKDIKSAKLLGELRSGTIFKWQAGPGTITSVLEEVEPQKTIGWSGKMPGIKAVHIWRIESKNGTVTVTTEESWSGVIPRLLKSYSRRTLVKAIDDGLALLKKSAEQ